MTNLQKQIMEGKDHESENVRSNLELPPLPEWSAQTGPVDLSDWLCVVEPLMADLSSSSSEWWSLIIKEAQAWYEAHLRLQPLDRVSHEAHASQLCHCRSGHVWRGVQVACFSCQCPQTCVRRWFPQNVCQFFESSAI